MFLNHPNELKVNMFVDQIQLTFYLLYTQIYKLCQLGNTSVNYYKLDQDLNVNMKLNHIMEDIVYYKF